MKDFLILLSVFRSDLCTNSDMGAGWIYFEMTVGRRTSQENAWNLEQLSIIRNVWACL